MEPETRRRLDALGIADEFNALRGSYTHHYPICVRRVLPDDTLLSMSSGTSSRASEPYYALSFISYSRPTAREDFLGFARFLSRSMGALFGARPHWGKICPLSRSDADRLYPQIQAFRELARRWDPEGRFQNRWTSELLR